MTGIEMFILVLSVALNVLFVALIVLLRGEVEMERMRGRKQRETVKLLRRQLNAALRRDGDAS